MKELLDINLDPVLLILPPDPTMDMNFHIRTELTQVICKKVYDTSTLRMIALETINTLYPESDWINLYTDESHANYIDIAGAGVQGNMFSFYSHVEKS